MLNKSYLSALASALLASLTLAGCAGGGLKEQPVAMPEVLPDTDSVVIEWWHILADEQAPKARAQLQPVVWENYAYVGLPDGEMFRLDQAGQVTPLGSVAEGLAASPAVSDGVIVLARNNGDISLLDLDLNEQWTTPLNALAGNQPVISAQRVFVQTIDGRINALERVTGRLLWAYQDAEPALTVTGTSQPVLVSTGGVQALVTGLANGKLIALNAADGSVLWEYRIARASGKNDVSRLVDVDAAVTVLGSQIIATGYQGDMVVIDIASGRVVQAREFSSYRSILVSDSLWFGVSADSHLVALNPGTLDIVWENTDFEYRRLSELVMLDGVLYVADFEGYLHLVNPENGDWLASRHIDWRGSNSNPVIFAGKVLLQGHSSRVKALTYSAN